LSAFERVIEKKPRNFQLFYSFQGYYTSIFATMTEIQKILKVATEMFFQFGIKSVSMDDISKKLGMSKKTIYIYVENKEDLVRQTVNNHILNSVYEIQAIFKDSSLNAIDLLVEVAKLNYGILRQMNPSAVYDLKKYYKTCWEIVENHHQKFISDYIKDNLRTGIAQELYRNGLNVDIITKIYLSQLQIISDVSLFSNNQFSIADVYVEFLKYHIFGISTEKGIKYFNKLMNKNESEQKKAV